MATFSNQTTNLSTLSTSLAALCAKFEALLESAEGKHSDENPEAKERRYDQAEEFLDSLVKRVDGVDDNLMKSTEYLLPTLSGRGEPSRMTATELAQVLSSLHDIHARKIEQFSALVGDNPPVAANNNSLSNEEDVDERPSGGNPYHWSLGLPLDRVVETDNETDRYSYSSVASIMSRSFSHTPGGKSPSTPQTPSIDVLRLSASTAKILTRDQHILDRSYRSEGEGNSCGSDTNNSSNDGEMEDEQNASGFLSKSRLKEKATLQRHNNTESVDGSVSHEMDDFDGSTNSYREEDDNSSKKVHATEASGDASGLHSTGEDESGVTTLCPTVVANNSPKPPKQVILSPEVDFRSSKQKIFRNQHDISHVIVQAETSPSQTLLTMDATMMDATMVLQEADASCQSSRRFSDAASLGDETPVLDRYRIIPDDNSIGFKILPNERGSQKRHRKKATLMEDGGTDENNIPTSVRFCEKTPYRENPHSYRTTPYISRGELSRNDGSGHASKITSSVHETKQKNDRTYVSSHDLHSSSMQLEKENRQANSPFLYEEPAKKTVVFKSPSHSVKTSTQESPFSKGREKQEDLSFDTSEITPLKDRAPTYRKTPHPSVAEKRSIDSLKFGPGTDFQSITSASPGVHFRDQPRKFASETPPMKRGGGFRKTLYRGVTSPAVKSYALETNVENNTGAMKSPLRFPAAFDQSTLASPVSLGSTISALTGITTFTDNQRVLFPEAKDLGTNDTSAPLALSRKSMSSLIAKISESEYDIIGSLQFSLEETNRAITALNGAALLRRKSGESLVFQDVEAYKILKSAGFRRRNAKGILMSLCGVWRRLEMIEENVLDTPSYVFRIVMDEH